MLSFYLPKSLVVFQHTTIYLLLSITANILNLLHSSCHSTFFGNRDTKQAVPRQAGARHAFADYSVFGIPEGFASSF